MHTAVWGIALAIQPSRHTQTPDTRPVSLRPQHTLTQTYTQMLTQERRTRHQQRHAHPDTHGHQHIQTPGCYIADPNHGAQAVLRRCTRNVYTRHTHDPPRPERSDKLRGITSSWRLESTSKQSHRRPPPPVALGTPALGAAHLPWRRPLPHSPSCERLAPPGAQLQAKSRSRGRTEEIPITLPGWLPAGRGRAWVPRGWGGGRR